MLLGPAAARQHREAQRRKNALESSSLPAKLVDCRSNDVDRTELFIVEGDSALGTAKLARNSEFQALLPIRGKILNVQKASVGDMLKNAECGSIIQAVGAGSGRSFDLEAARYGKIIFMADADSDGAHIRCLLATLFFRYMRPLVAAGRVFTAVPPLHRFELTNARKGQEKYIYTYSDAEYQRKAAELTKRGLHFKEPQRYKGLGEMDADQLAETTMNPRHRTLRRMTVDDGLIAETTFEMLMGNDVGPQGVHHRRCVRPRRCHHRRLSSTSTELGPAFEEAGVHVVVEAAHDSPVADEWVIPELLDVAMQRTPLIGRGAEPHPGGVGTAGVPDAVDDHVVVGRGHGAAAVRNHHDAVDLEQVDTCNAAGQSGGGHATARGADDLGVTEGQSNHFQRYDPGVHAGDHQDSGMGYPVEAVQIKSLSELLVVGKQIIEGIGRPS